MSLSGPFEEGSNLPKPDNPPLRTLGGYQLVREVGVGAMGQVWLARDARLERNVAIKMMRGEIARDPVYIERFEREAKAVARLSHPNIVQIYSFGEESGLIYFVMEWVQGQTLAGRIREQGAIPRKEALAIVRQAADALDYACRMSIIHRDIKPGNVMQDITGTVKVTDFGLAKFGDQDSHMTATGAPMGSPSYMSPEACRGEALDHRADIYSLGVTFYQMLHGELPFSAPTPMSVMFKHVSEPLPEPESLVMLDDGMWMDVLRKMTAKSLNERYGTYAELLDALDSLKFGSTGSGQLRSVSGPLFLGGARAEVDSLQTRPLGAAAVRTSAHSNTRRGWRAAGIVAMVVAAAAGGWYWYENQGRPVNQKAEGTDDRVAALSDGERTKEFDNMDSMTSPNPAAMAGPPIQITAHSPVPAQSDTQTDPPVTFIKTVSPQAAEALENYDFAAVQQLLTQALQAGAVPEASRASVELLARDAGKLVGFRESLIKGTSQNPGPARMKHAEHGDLTMVGGTERGFKFQSAAGIIELPFREVPPSQLMLMGGPYSQPGTYKSTADALMSFWPSIRSVLPQPGGPAGGPAAGGGQPRGRQHGGQLQRNVLPGRPAVGVTHAPATRR